MRNFKIFLILFVLSFKLSAQTFEKSDLFGSWKIKKWIFIRVNGSSETINQSGMYNDYKEFIGQSKDSLKYLNSIVSINSTGITIPGNDRTIKYYFDSCYQNFLKTPLDSSLTKLRVVKDTRYTYNAWGEEMENKGIIGKQFLHFLDKGYSKPSIQLIETNCIKDGVTLQILLISKNKIAIYRKMDVIVLEKKHK